MKRSAQICSEIKLSDVNCSRGAPMGRGNDTIIGKCKLQRVRMSGPYDEGGAYWGLGVPLYVAEDATGLQAFVRAHTHHDAKALLEDMYEVTFYR